MLRSIDHVNIVVSDIRRSTKFFCALGFAVQHEGELEGEWISKIVGLDNVRARFASLELPGAETKLELIQYHSPTSPNDSEGGMAHKLGIRHIAFRVDDLDSIHAKLCDMGIEFLSDVQSYEPTRKKLVYFYGPEGILLELAQYGNHST